MKKRDLLRRIEELETRLALVENRAPAVWPCVEPMPVYPFWDITLYGTSGVLKSSVAIGIASTNGISGTTTWKLTGSETQLT